MPVKDGKDQSVLVNKLILVVLIGILGCLVILVVRQNDFLTEQQQFTENRLREDWPSAQEDSRADQRSLVANRRAVVPLRVATTRPPEAPLAPIAVQVNTEVPPGVTLIESAPQVAVLPVETAVVSASQALPAGEITGTVWLRGTPPPEIPIQMDAWCGRLHTNAVTTRHFVVSSDGRLANVFVYVKSGLRPARYAPPDVTPLLDQRGCLFEPYVLGVMAGQKFKIRNSDPTLHNVNTSASRLKSHQFNLAQPHAGRINEKSFDQPEVFVKVVCNLHQWMVSFIGVVEHPYFAVTDTDGHFRFPFRLPPGTYILAAKHPKAGELTRQVTVDQSDHPPIAFTFDAAAIWGNGPVAGSR